MNISNLKQGETYKNYKALCEVLEDKVKTGDSKKYQLKEWERYFTYTKQGNKFIINEIYDQPKEKEDLRTQGNNAAIYIKDIENLILDLLGQERNSGQLFLSRNKLLQELKMINQDYTYYKTRKLDLSKFMDIHIEEINDFYESSNSTFKSNLETALNRLQRQSLIYWEYALTICYIDTRIQKNETGKIKALKRTQKNAKGEYVTTYDTVQPITELSYRKASKEEIAIILEIERDTLRKYNCKDKSELYKRGYTEDFYNDVKEILFERTNIIFYYKSFEIIFNDRHIQERLEELRLEETRQYMTQSSLNRNIIYKLNDNAQIRHSKAKEEINNNIFDDILPKRIEARGKEEYIENTYRLADTLIKNT